ncbi:MAG: mechanosensitive ion channel family protein [Deltaproteobacteria bacterium]|nr:mechanosensitive ion channel family protein [Deltaproteobacteria bacterium]
MPDELMRLMDFEVLGCPLGQLVLALLAVLGGLVARVAVRGLMARLARLAAIRSRNALERVDDVLVHAATAPAGWAAVLLGFYAALRFLPLPVDIDLLVGDVAKGTSIFLLVWFVVRISDRACDVWAEHAGDGADAAHRQAIPIIRTVLRVFIIVVGGAFVLQNLGYSVGSLLAGLGLGGAAIALAAKDTLSNVFGAIVIFWDRPFRLGDWVEIGGVEGTVEEVNLRTTRIRTFDHSVVTVPNASLTTANVTNWTRMTRRRFEVTVGLTYDATADQMEEAAAAIRTIIEESEDLYHDGYVVNLYDFGASSLDIAVVCNTVATDQVGHRQAKERFLLAVMRKLAEMGLSIAFPTRTVHVETMPK